MGPLLAWLPFLVAIVLAFAAGVVFARINESLVAGTHEELSHAGRLRLRRLDLPLMTVIVALLAAVLVVWFVAAVYLFERGVAR